MDESGYLMMIEDDEADLILQFQAGRRAVMLPDQPNDIPLDQAVAEMHHISAELHRGLKPYETSGGMLT